MSPDWSGLLGHNQVHCFFFHSIKKDCKQVGFNDVNANKYDLRAFNRTNEILWREHKHNVFGKPTAYWWKMRGCPPSKSNVKWPFSKNTQNFYKSKNLRNFAVARICHMENLVKDLKAKLIDNIKSPRKKSFREQSFNIKLKPVNPLDNCSQWISTKRVS